MSPNYQRLLEHGDARQVGDILAAGSEASIEKRLRAFADAGATDVSVRVVPIGDGRDELIASSKRTREYLASLPAASSSLAGQRQKRYSPNEERRSQLERGNAMSQATLDIPVFDADNHLYETRDAFTKFLPDRYQHAVDYVDVRGRTKIVVRGRISDYIPNPTFDVVARPGAMEDYFRTGNPEGKNRREIFGEPMRAIAAFREPARTRRADGRAGHRPGADVPDAGQPPRGAHEGRPGDDPRRHPLAQRVDVRDVDASTTRTASSPRR